MPYPCRGERVSVFRISMSRVPGKRSGFLAIVFTIDRLWVDCQCLAIFQGSELMVGKQEVIQRRASRRLYGDLLQTDFWTAWLSLVNFRLARDRKSTRLNSSHIPLSRMPSSA